MKLLIVEDEERIAKSLQRGLVDEGYDVDICVDGEEALSTLRKTEYDTIVLDLMIPKINGITVLRKMRERKVQTPVIILTAKNTLEDRVDGLDIGADDYLAKPFDFEELLARIRALIRRSTANSNALKIDNLELDPQSHKVTRDGKEIELSKKEFQILEYMMSRKGYVINESQMTSHVWNNDSGTSNIVAVHIKNLRRKVNKDFPEMKPLIKTIRGVGYKIDE